MKLPRTQMRVEGIPNREFVYRLRRQRKRMLRIRPCTIPTLKEPQKWVLRNQELSYETANSIQIKASLKWCMGTSEISTVAWHHHVISTLLPRDVKQGNLTRHVLRSYALPTMCDSESDKQENRLLYERGWPEFIFPWHWSCSAGIGTPTEKC